MALILNDDQTQLTDTARAFVAKRCPSARLRTLRDDPIGFDPRVWSAMVELGWTGIPFAEDDGGLGLGLADVICVTEALGRGLATEPFLSNVMLAGAAISRCGSTEQKARWLGPMIAGELHLALSHVEPKMRFDPLSVTTTARRENGTYRIDGDKTQVLGGSQADHFVVVAKVSDAERSDAVGLFVVPASTQGLTVTRQHRVDGAPVAAVSFSAVSVDASHRLDGGDAEEALLDVIDRATVALAAEMLGAASAAFEMTQAYLKERVQFGVKIGSFQALKHRAARVFIELELTRSAVLAAAHKVDAGDDDARKAVSVAKARANDAFLLSANEAIQMHGGIGMTDEHDVGFFLKRARAAEMTFGDSAYHRARYAELEGL